MRSDHGARHEMIPRRKPPSVPPSPRARVGVQAANPSRPPKTVLALYGSAHKQSVAPLALETASYAIATLSVSAERRRRRRREAVGAGLTKTQQRATRQRARPTASPSCCGQGALPRRALRHRRLTPRAGEVSAIRQCELVSGWGGGGGGRGAPTATAAITATAVTTRAPINGRHAAAASAALLPRATGMRPWQTTHFCPPCRPSAASGATLSMHAARGWPAHAPRRTTMRR